MSDFPEAIHKANKQTRAKVTVPDELVVGVGRIAENDRFLSLACRRVPTDNELRAIYNLLTNTPEDYTLVPVEADYKHLGDDFTEIVGGGLHLYENSDKLDLVNCTAAYITNMTSGWLARYRNEPMFQARVKNIVAMLMQSVINHKEKV